MNNVGTPAAEIAVEAPLVRALLHSQFPEFASRDIRLLDHGWDNALFRLGDDLIARLPRREAAAQLLANEQRWLPLIQKQLSLPIPAPVCIGKPDVEFPWAWSIAPWFAGETADINGVRDDQASVLAKFLNELHTAAPVDAPRNPVRGVALAAREMVMRERIARLRAKTNYVTPKILRVWDEALTVPIDIDATWIHGDLHARNVLVHQGALSAIIDWGDLAQGDRATDLASIWMLPANQRARCAAIERYASVSEATWRRAKGWAVLFGITLLDTGLIDHPRHAAMGARTLASVMEDD